MVLAQKVLLITFNVPKGVRLPSEEELCEMPGQILAKQPGLIFKYWITKDAGQRTGGVYVFDSQEHVDAYLAGPVVASLKEHYTDFKAEVFDIMQLPSQLTSAPFTATEIMHG